MTDYGDALTNLRMESYANGKRDERERIIEIITTLDPGQLYGITPDQLRKLLEATNASL